ncbi:mitochondrial fission ELM1 family protein [Chelatococcus sambhunathii]|uniref:Mitochondrial fission ELM1 family protein n=1 Tax=Chelatococcus sambhunathii TaxID=363953 RepID=A0ABU1DJL4_9HYPH|nr:ELM1/GtrOC1 family putative glycosyltransferase [Chelatococcus sambhunathii]MDR4308200.1 mitochondrial fission ELM1 family protein [Chelatococcus sambhunathii]
MTPSEDDQPEAAIWGLLGNRRGDNAMIEAVIAATGLPARLVRLRFNKFGALQNTFPGGSLFTLTRDSRAELTPPWPRVVVTSGKRAVPAALRVRRASSGRTRLLHLGRPQAPLDWFDLVVTTPQYHLPARPNVVVCRLPSTTLSMEEASVDPTLATLPRPRIAVIVGGSEPPQRLDPDAARRLAETALSRAQSSGGSLLVATSPRTGPAATAALREALDGADAPVKFSAYGNAPNLYRAFLAAADAFLVTDDSVSMVVEAAATTRPVELFHLPALLGPGLRAFKAIEGAAKTGGAVKRALDALVGAGLVRSNRDIAGYMDDLENDGLLAGGESLRRLAEKELAETAVRVRTLAGLGSL